MCDDFAHNLEPITRCCGYIARWSARSFQELNLAFLTFTLLAEGAITKKIITYKL